MFFHESEAIAREHPDLHRVVEQVDRQLSGICSPAPLRPADFSCALGADENQVVSVFELLARREVLHAEDMVECERCQNVMSADAFQQAVQDEDPFECSGCGRVFPRRSEPLALYRMTAGALSRTKAAAEPKTTTRDPTAEDIDGVGERGILVDPNTFTITANGRSHTFKGRSKLLFALFERINRRPGYQVPFDTLRQKNDVWDGVVVEDVTIRGAVSRLKKTLKKTGMNDLAATISTGRFQNRPFVILDHSRSKSN